MVKKIPLNGKKRWRVLFSENEKWLVGIYIPNAKSREELPYLEKHSSPELFLLLDGSVTLVLSNGKRKRDAPLRKNELLIVDEWHNGYSKKGGKALVVERVGQHTKYIKLRTSREP